MTLDGQSYCPSAAFNSIDVRARCAGPVCLATICGCNYLQDRRTQSVILPFHCDHWCRLWLITSPGERPTDQPIQGQVQPHCSNTMLIFCIQNMCFHQKNEWNKDVSGLFSWLQPCDCDTVLYRRVIAYDGMPLQYISLQAIVVEASFAPVWGRCRSLVFFQARAISSR